MPSADQLFNETFFRTLTGWRIIWSLRLGFNYGLRSAEAGFAKGAAQTAASVGSNGEPQNLIRRPWFRQ